MVHVLYINNLKESSWYRWANRGTEKLAKVTSMWQKGYFSQFSKTSCYAASYWRLSILNVGEWRQGTGQSLKENPYLWEEKGIRGTHWLRQRRMVEERNRKVGKLQESKKRGLSRKGVCDPRDVLQMKAEKGIFQIFHLLVTVTGHLPDGWLSGDKESQRERVKEWVGGRTRKQLVWTLCKMLKIKWLINFWKESV